MLAAGFAALGLWVAGCGTSSRHTTSATGGPSTTSSSTTSLASQTSSSTTASGTRGSVPHAVGLLTVTPAKAHPTSVVRFTVVGSSASGRQGQDEISYTLSVSGGQGSGCVGEHSSPVAVADAQQPVEVAVGPAQLGGRWCAGTYTARVEELERPVCSPGQVCPQFIRVVAVIGPVRFRITP